MSVETCPIPFGPWHSEQTRQQCQHPWHWGHWVIDHQQWVLRFNMFNNKYTEYILNHPLFWILNMPNDLNPWTCPIPSLSSELLGPTANPHALPRLARMGQRFWARSAVNHPILSPKSCWLYIYITVIPLFCGWNPAFLPPVYIPSINLGAIQFSASA